MSVAQDMQDGFAQPDVDRIWTVTESKAGTLTQCVGVAKYLNPEPVTKVVSLTRGIRKWFEPPLFRRREQRPDIVISCGFRSEKPVLAIKEAYGGKPLAVHLQKPRIEGYDMVFVSRHDWKAELDGRPGYHPMTGVPHQITAARLDAIRTEARAKFKADDRRVVSVFVGGSNGAYVYDDRTHEGIAAAIEGLRDEGWRVLVSVSRRSEDATLQQLMKLRSPDVDVWDRKSENPFLQYMAAADGFLIAKDSITMPCEALATGRPVYSLDISPVPGPRLDKFEFYHRDLSETLRLTRPFAGEMAPYDYEPLDETRRIASVIRARLAVPE